MQLTIKTSWDAVTICDYMNYKNALDNPNTTDFEKKLDVLAILCHITREELMDLPASQIVPLFNKMEFLTKPPTAEVEPYYEIAGKKFKLIMDVTQLTAGQFIDLSHYTKDPAFIIDNLHAICAILLLPVKPYRGKKDIIPTEKYGETPIGEIAEFLYENMPIKEALGISNFFTCLYNLFMQITKRYLEQERTKLLNKASKMLSKNTMNQLSPETGSRKSGNGLRQ